MRLAIINDEVHQDLGTVIDSIRRTGLDGVELRSCAGVPPHHLDDAQLDAIRRDVRQAGLEIAGFCPPALKCPLPETDEDLARTAELLARAVAQARLLGAPHIRIFSFYRTGDPAPERAARAAERVLAAVDLTGVELLLETGTRTNTPTIAHSLRFLDALGRDELGILWDPGNSVFSGWHADPYPADYELGRQLIRHVHVKDPDGRNGYVRLGDGDLPWPAIVRRLADDGYDGWLSLETHWRHGRVLTQAQRDEPWGEPFSADGYHASVECMRILRQMVEATR
ncbi:sugar phosphate isomerase/epimerase [Micromonospora sp. PLK6-60]|uniref:sugar phosphate isomerase/epimerase family protein n=1 Tax=Micromonospora sp. PLK6-60 TaxID=2873383 RepID=UPI001CA73C69|nr:sugar phosphate isomerase/epimerase family protein [Micromonospora sp. PLK6-60]MBY8870652.1 sugar phosphate isomerase/epimerase [Micromonospora sp. PLK6-60]